MGMQVGGGGGDALNSEINVTPFVDVMLVLLVIFMITAPMMNTGVDITLPQTNAENIDTVEDKLILSIDKTRSLTLNKERVTWVDLERALQQKLATDAKVRASREIYVEADEALPYGVVVTAMAIAKESGLSKVMMMTDPANQMSASQMDKTVTAPPPAAGDGAEGAP